MEIVSSTAIGYNGDLITLILLRLPVKSIVRLQTVSKQWHSIVSSCQFRQIHAASASGVVTVTGLFLNKGTSENPELEFLVLDNHTCPMPNFNQDIKIISSSGGLHLLLGSNNQDYFIWNPTTDEIKQLAAIPQIIRESESVFANLAFDASKSPHYKVIFGCTPKTYKFPLIIYSSETRTYKSVETNYIDMIQMNNNGIYCNDAIHWVVAVNGNCVTYFDLSKECINEFRFPDVGIVLYSGEAGGNLHMVTRLHLSYRVYELKRDYSCWSLNYKVDIFSLKKEIPQICAFNTGVLSIFEDEKEGLTIVLQVMDYFNSLVACNLEKKLCNVLIPDTSWYTKAYHHKATLACV